MQVQFSKEQTVDLLCDHDVVNAIYEFENLVQRSVHSHLVGSHDQHGSFHVRSVDYCQTVEITNRTEDRHEIIGWLSSVHSSYYIRKHFAHSLLAVHGLAGNASKVLLFFYNSSSFT